MDLGDSSKSNVGAWAAGKAPDFVIPNEVRDLHLAAKLQIPHFVRDDKGKEF
jgi:hypothetical protein